MTPEQWRRVNSLFDTAVVFPPGGQRAYIDREAADDSAVREEVLGLLKAHTSNASFLARPLAHLSPQSRLSRLSEQLKSARSFAPGEVVGDFAIQRLIGEGAFAHVYLAEQRSLGRLVALKVTTNVGREARTMAGLEHDHIVTVFSETVDAASDLRIICMQLVVGTTLQQVIDRLGQLPASERSGAAILAVIDAADADAGTLFNAAAVRDRESLSRMDFYTACLWLGARMADALAFAHARGILHLDVKPANILLNRYGRPLLSDFNVSLTPEDLVSRSPALGGTISYMSPEHHAAFSTGEFARVASIDARSDVYSLGIVLTELLTCRRVETEIDEATGTTILKHTGDLPEEIASVLHRAVKVRQRDRFPDAGELISALENCAEVAIIRRKVPAHGRLMALIARRPVLSMCALALIPQIAGTAVNITYNSIRIAQELTLAQQKAFVELILPYNVIFYPAGIFILWRQLAFLMRSLRERRDRTMPNPESMAALRRKVLWTPYALVLATTIGWLPGAILFPFMIGRLAGPVAPHVYVHYLVSFVSSWMIALTYSFLLIESVTLMIIYPRFWTGCCNIRESSRFELRRVGRRLRVFQVLAGLIPLAGAMMIVGAGPDIADPGGYYAFQVMVVGLISLGMCGFVFAMKTSENIKRTVEAFTA